MDSNIGKVIATKDGKSITKLNDPKSPKIAIKRRKLYSPGDNFQCEENSNNIISQNDELLKVKPPDVYSASEDCIGNKTIRKKYLITRPDKKSEISNNEKSKTQRSKGSKPPQKLKKTTSASKFSNFIEKGYKDKESVYDMSSDDDGFVNRNKKTKNMKKKRKEQKNQNRDEVHKCTILTKSGRLVKKCNYADSDTATSANDSSLISKSRFRKSLSLKHHNDILSDERIRKDANDCLDAKINVTIDEVRINNKETNDKDLIPKTLKNNILMEEQIDEEIINNIFSKVTSPEPNNMPCIENIETKNTIKATPSKLNSNKSRITIDKATTKTKKLLKNKKSSVKDLNETSESLPPLIVEAVSNQRRNKTLDDITSLTIEKIKIALNRPMETTLDDLQSDGTVINENTCKVVDSDVLVESHSDILHEHIKISEVNNAKEENNLLTVKEMFTAENKDENEQANNKNTAIEYNIIANSNLPNNSEIQANSITQKLTESIACKDHGDQTQEITQTSIIINISDSDESMNGLAGCYLNTTCLRTGESPVRKHVDTTSVLPVTLADLRRTLSPRQFSDRSNHVSPDQVLGHRTRRYIDSRRFFTDCNLWSDSSSSDGDLRTCTKKNLKRGPTLSPRQKVNKPKTLFCNTPEEFERHDSTKLMENSSALLGNLSSLTVHISPIKWDFCLDQTKNKKTQNEIFHGEEQQQMIRKKKLPIRPLANEITSNNNNNDMLYKSMSLDCHISPIKFPPLLSADINLSSASEGSESPVINHEVKVMPLLDSETDRDSAANCSVENLNENNLMGVQLPEEDHEELESPSTDTDLSMRSEPRREPSLQPDLCTSDLKSRWKSVQDQLTRISDTDVQLQRRIGACEDCFRDIKQLTEQQQLQNAKIKEDMSEIRKLILKF